MDTLTHSLVGVALSRAGLNKLHQNATLLLLIGANLPDIDLMSRVRGQLFESEIHNGYTHAIVALPVLALVCVGIAGMIRQERLPLIRSSLLALIGLASHLFLDCLDSFGIRLMLPFSSRWFYLDLNGSYDGVLLTALVIACLWPWFVSLVLGEIGPKIKPSGQGSAILVLSLFMAYEGARWSVHSQVVNGLSARLYDGEIPMGVAALADANNPFRWSGIIETEDAFRWTEVESIGFSGDVDARVFRKPATDKTYTNLMRYEPFRYMAYFSRFPVWDSEPFTMRSGVGQRITLSDLRFASSNIGNQQASALVDRNGMVLRTGFGSNELNQ